MQEKITFKGAHGADLAARLDRPAGPIRAVALFAHCFTCSKDIFAAKRIASSLAAKGYAVLRFDFTGLGNSGGDFASTNFSSNVQDLVLAANWLRDNLEAPSILVGHSLGGAAVLVAGGDIPEVQAIATIGAPSDAEHVVHNFGDDIQRIETDGEATVKLAGRPFKIRKQFLDDLEKHNVQDRVAKLNKALMILHAPLDETVSIENAAEIYNAAKHPKSFISLDTANHLLTNRDDAEYVSDVIAAWASRYVGRKADDGMEEQDAEHSEFQTIVRETGEGKFQASIRTGKHMLLADEPESVGGMNTGPSPYDLLAAGLGACTTMTMRLYADFKKLKLPPFSVTVHHNKVHAKDCVECAEEMHQRTDKVDRFERVITLDENIDAETREKLLKIADKCPVHKTLSEGAAIVTKLAD
jgi:uncharacterized OsmC-like protein/alpha-beta hydrolase superfamily lysophospholipase